MSQPVIAADHEYMVPATSLDASADLQTILAAWHTATLRLEQTHDALRDEVRAWLETWGTADEQPAPAKWFR